MQLKKLKNSKLFFWLGIVSVPVLVALTVFVCYLFSFHPKSSGEHRIKNSLNEKISIAACFKDGNIYYFNGTEKTLVAENCYDVNSENPVYTADYAISKESGKMIFIADKKLYLSENGDASLIASNVTSFKTSNSMNVIAFTTPWRENRDSSLGTLYLYDGVKVIPVDQGITVSSVRFSQNGNCFYAEKPNVYPEIHSRLIRYDLNGNGKVVVDSCMPVMWISDDGSTVITGESYDDSLYSYVIYGSNFKKNVQISNVYYPSVSEDKSILYLLANYNEDKKTGKLIAVDLRSFKQKELATDVSFFTTDSVTNSSAGVVYSSLTDKDNGYYSVYFCDIKGKSTRLVRNTDENTIYSVAINTDSNDGYILAPGKTRTDCAVYYIKWKNGKLDTVKLDSGYVDGLVYYERNNIATYIKNPSADGCDMYVADKSTVSLLTDFCGANYNSGTQNFTSLSVLSNDGENVLMFNNIELGNTEADIYGNLFIKKDSASPAKLGENISSSYMSSPIVSGDFSQIYFCKRKTATLFDLYYYNGENAVLIEENINGIAEVY